MERMLFWIIQDSSQSNALKERRENLPASSKCSGFVLGDPADIERSRAKKTEYTRHLNDDKLEFAHV